MSTAPVTRRAYRVITINITPGSTPSVDVDPVEISKGRADEICWHCQDPNWRVDFGNNSPFQASQFDQSRPCSGPAAQNARDNHHYYKYTVTAGGGTLDPGVIVDQ